MYIEPPTNVISLHEFYKLSLDRLQVLKKIEFMYDANADREKIKEDVLRLTEQHNFAIYKTVQQKENDNISHFICRLAYCRNEELRKWFLTQEVRLFSIRVDSVEPKNIQMLLEQQCGIKYESCNENVEEWDRLK